MHLSGSDAKAASLSTTMWSSAACSDWSIQSRLPDMWQALRVTSTKWLTDSSNAVALRTNSKICKLTQNKNRTQPFWQICSNMIYCTYNYYCLNGVIKLPGIQENGIEGRIHRPNHIIHPVTEENISVSINNFRDVTLQNSFTLGWCVWPQWWCHSGWQVLWPLLQTPLSWQQAFQWECGISR